MRKTTNSLSKRIKEYTALATSFLAIHQIADGQIIYTRLDSEITVSGNGAFYNLDLNNDGTADFVIRVASNGFLSASVIASALSKNAIQGFTNGTPSRAFPSALPASVTIGPGASWIAGGNQVMAAVNTGITSTSSSPTSSSSGFWPGAVNSYLALQLNVNDSTSYYGWARLDVSPNPSLFTIKDYAYESIADSSILSGETGAVGITSIKPQNTVIFAANGNITIQMHPHSEPATITITNILGQIVRELKTSNASVTMSMQDQPAGIYLVTVEENRKFFTKKIYL